MKLTELLDKLEQCRAQHGNVYIAVRHTARHEFTPADDLTAISAEYDSRNNLFVINVEN